MAPAERWGKYHLAVVCCWVLLLIVINYAFTYGASEPVHSHNGVTQTNGKLTGIYMDEVFHIPQAQRFCSYYLPRVSIPNYIHMRAVDTVTTSSFPSPSSAFKDSLASAIDASSASAIRADGGSNPRSSGKDETCATGGALAALPSDAARASGASHTASSTNTNTNTNTNTDAMRVDINRLPSSAADWLELFDARSGTCVRTGC